MKLQEMFSHRLNDTNKSLKQQALQEAAEKFQSHPSSASLTWAAARYQRLLRERKN
jgi:hypothetical protein